MSADQQVLRSKREEEKKRERERNRGWKQVWREKSESWLNINSLSDSRSYECLLLTPIILLTLLTFPPQSICFSITLLSFLFPRREDPYLTQQGEKERFFFLLLLQPFLIKPVFEGRWRRTSRITRRKYLLTHLSVKPVNLTVIDDFSSLCFVMNPLFFMPANVRHDCWMIMCRVLPILVWILSLHFYSRIRINFAWITPSHIHYTWSWDQMQAYVSFTSQQKGTAIFPL